MSEKVFLVGAIWFTSSFILAKSLELHAISGLRHLTQFSFNTLPGSIWFGSQLFVHIFNFSSTLYVS